MASTIECSCTYVLVLAEPIINFTMESSPHSVLRSAWPCNFSEGSMCLFSTSTQTTLRFIGFGCFCTAAVVTISHGWSKTCSKVQILVVPVASSVQAVLGHNEAKRPLLPPACPSAAPLAAPKSHVLHYTFIKKTLLEEKYQTYLYNAPAQCLAEIFNISKYEEHGNLDGFESQFLGRLIRGPGG